jgi:hypothetical protein
MTEKEAGATPVEGADGLADWVADQVGEEARHLGHNFEENFPGLVEAAEHLLEKHPKVRGAVEHLEHNFAENFPHLAGHAKENVND